MSEYESNEIDEFDGLAEATDGSSTFRKFKSKHVAAEEWIKDLIKNGYRSGDRRSRRALVDEGLFLSDEMQEIGVLSIAPSLSALLFELAQLHDKNHSKTDDAENEENKKKGILFEDILTENKSAVLNVVISSVCKLLAECFPNGVKSGNILLSSMPFYDDTTATEGIGWDRGGYLDSASWVFLAADSIEAFLNRFEKVLPDEYAKLKWEVKGDKLYREDETLTTGEVRKAVRALYLSCIKTTCDCIIRRDGKVLGWSFRKMNSSAEPSLYFSYVASTVYLGLYKRFNGEKDTIDKLREYEKQLLSSEDTAVRFKFYERISVPAELEKTVKRLRRNGFDDFADYLEKLSAEELQELDLLYNTVNDGQPLTGTIDEGDKGSFTVLKEAAIELASRLWNEGFGERARKVAFKVNMAKGPCFEDGTPVDMDIIRLSSHNNAFFNNLFVIGIILNSAYDAELARLDREEYGRMLNAFQLAIQNTQRCYNEIEGEGLLYKIDSYILDFSEKVDADNTELAKQLRKVNIAAVPLLPLMLKNNNLMSQYVVQYPQKQMKESLKDIIRNKKRKDGVSSWVWDKDGYNAITNYYYIDALIAFYRYYEQYERPFVSTEEAVRSAERQAQREADNDYKEKLTALNRQHADELAWRDEYIDNARAVFKGLAGFIVNGLIDLVDSQLSSKNLLGELEGTELSSREKIIDRLNSFTKDTDTVKLSTLVRLTEKLQLLSLLSIGNNDALREFLKNGDPQGSKNAHSTIIKSAFGEGGDSAGFMLNLITSLISAKKPENK